VTTGARGRRFAPMTIRARVAWATFLSLAAILLLVGLVVDRLDYRAALDAVDARLAGDAEALAAAVDYDGQKIEFDFQDEIITSFARPRCGAYFQVSTSRGLLERSRSLDGKSLPDPGPDDLALLDPGRLSGTAAEIIPGPFEPAVRLWKLAARRHPRRGDSSADSRELAAAAGDVTVFVQVARSISEIEKGWWGERLTVVTGLSLALILGTFAAFIIARRVTVPIRTLTEDARLIAAGGSQARLEIGSVEGELRELAVFLNQGFDRLASTLTREKRFAADAAHELRTPLTACRARLEHALSRDRTPDEYRAAIQAALDANLRLERLVEGLLLLSRADRPIEPGASVDLRAVVRSTLDSLQRSAHEGPVRFAEPSEPVVVKGHGDLLASMVAGLVGNARRHGASPEGVEVRLAKVGDRAEILVLDRGPGFSPAMLDRMFEGFARGDASRSRSTGGSGLGLAIASAIVDAHRGTIEAGAREGGGASIRVTLPLAEPPRTSGPGPGHSASVIVRSTPSTG
jgi:signal transduction histidine kinase